jgi:hypothetical protein
MGEMAPCAVLIRYRPLPTSHPVAARLPQQTRRGSCNRAGFIVLWGTDSKLPTDSCEVSPVPTDRNFGYTFAAIMAFLALYSAWKSLGIEVYSTAGSIVCAFLATFLPHLLRPLNGLWFRIGNLLHKVVSPIVLLALYAIVIVPSGIIMKLLKQDPLRRSLDPSRQSYWEERPVEEVTIDRMKRQF